MLAQLPKLTTDVSALSSAQQSAQLFDIAENWTTICSNHFHHRFGLVSVWETVRRERAPTGRCTSLTSRASWRRAFSAQSCRMQQRAVARARHSPGNAISALAVGPARRCVPRSPRLCRAAAGRDLRDPLPRRRCSNFHFANNNRKTPPNAAAASASNRPAQRRQRTPAGRRRIARPNSIAQLHPPGASRSATGRRGLPRLPRARPAHAFSLLAEVCASVPMRSAKVHGGPGTGTRRRGNVGQRAQTTELGAEVASQRRAASAASHAAWLQTAGPLRSSRGRWSARGRAEPAPGKLLGQHTRRDHPACIRASHWQAEECACTCAGAGGGDSIAHSLHRHCPLPGAGRQVG